MIKRRTYPLPPRRSLAITADDLATAVVGVVMLGVLFDVLTSPGSPYLAKFRDMLRTAAGEE